MVFRLSIDPSFRVVAKSLFSLEFDESFLDARVQVEEGTSLEAAVGASFSLDDEALLCTVVVACCNQCCSWELGGVRAGKLEVVGSAALDWPLTLIATECAQPEREMKH